MSERTCYHSGLNTFETWSKDGTDAQKFWIKWLGPFDPSMTADKAAELLEHDKLTQEAQNLFKKGWNEAQQKYQAAQRRP